MDKDNIWSARLMDWASVVSWYLVAFISDSLLRDDLYCLAILVVSMIIYTFIDGKIKTPSLLKQNHINFLFCFLSNVIWSCFFLHCHFFTFLLICKYIVFLLFNLMPIFFTGALQSCVCEVWKVLQKFFRICISM